MKLLLKLIVRDAWRHRSRLSLAVMATVAMSCLIVWLIGSLDLMVLQFDEDGEKYLGRYHLAMIPERPESPQQAARNGREGRPPVFPESVIAELRANDLVVQVSPARQIRNVMGKMQNATDHRAALRRQRSIIGVPMQSPMIIGIDATESPFEPTDGRWFEEKENVSDSPVFEGVMGTGAAASLQGWGDETTSPVKVGDTVICRVNDREYKIQVVGLVEQKLATASRGNVSPAVGALYVSMQTAEQISPSKPGVLPPIDYVYVQLREGTNLNRFKKIWGKQLQSQNITMCFLDADDLQQQLNQTRSRNAVAGLMGGAASLNSILAFTTIVSILIVLTTLSMGVSERARVFAMLRTVGMSRLQIAALVFGESVILCLFGWVGGMIAGWAVLQLSVTLQPEVFGVGKTVSLGWPAVLTAGCAAMIGSLLAAVIPAWRATRISPLEGMNRGSSVDVRRNRIVVPAMIGLLLLTISPLLIYGGESGEHAAWRMRCYSLVGLPTQIIGCVLIVPAMILLVEKLFSPVVAKLSGVPKPLLKSQLSSNLWRTFGTTTALCVGLTMYTFFEISGYSMLKPYVYSSRLPDTLVTFLPRGIPQEDVPMVRDAPGVDADRFLTLAIDQSLFSPRQTEQFLERGLAAMQTSAVMFGLDIDKAFGKQPDGSPPMLELEFRQGTLESALQKLKTGGRYCLVPDSFAFRTRLKVGDKLELVLPDDVISNNAASNETVVEYEICGVVSIDGWIWMNKISGVRKRGYRSGAMLIAPYEAVKCDYKIDDTAFFWFDRTLDLVTCKPIVSDVELEESLQQIADTLIGNAGVPETSDGERGVTHPMVKVSSREYLNDRVGSRADDVIQAAAKMPMILLAISSFGMMGTIAASVRTRRFELGVLRSLGVTRWGLVRLVLAEAILISIAAIVISLGAGTIAAWCFIGLAQYVSVFGGFASPLVIPVSYLTIGFGVTLALCTLAALFPAIIAAQKEPTILLQEN